MFNCLRLLILLFMMMFTLVPMCFGINVDVELPDDLKIYANDIEARVLYYDFAVNGYVYLPDKELKVNPQGVGRVYLDDSHYAFIVAMAKPNVLISLKSKREALHRREHDISFKTVKVGLGVSVDKEAFTVNKLTIRCKGDAKSVVWERESEDQALPEIYVTPEVFYEVIIGGTLNGEELFYQGELVSGRFSQLRLDAGSLASIEPKLEKVYVAVASQADSDQATEVGQKKSRVSLVSEKILVDKNPLELIDRLDLKIEPKVSFDSGDIEIHRAELFPLRNPDSVKSYMTEDFGNEMTLKTDTVYSLQLIGEIDGDPFVFTDNILGESLSDYVIKRSWLNEKQIIFSEGTPRYNDLEIQIDYMLGELFVPAKGADAVTFLTNRWHIRVGYRFSLGVEEISDHVEAMLLDVDMRQEGDVIMGGILRANVWAESMHHKGKNYSTRMFGKLFLVDSSERILGPVNVLDEYIDWELVRWDDNVLPEVLDEKKWPLGESIEKEVKAKIIDGKGLIGNWPVSASPLVEYRSAHFFMNVPEFMKHHARIYLERCETMYAAASQAPTKQDAKNVRLRFRITNNNSRSTGRSNQWVSMPVNSLINIHERGRYMKHLAPSMLTLFGVRNDRESHQVASIKRYTSMWSTRKLDPQYLPEIFAE